MLNNLGLGIMLQAKDEFSSVMDRAKRSFGEADNAAGGLTSRFSTMTKVAAVAAAAVVVAATGIYGSFKLAGQAGEFERALTGVAAISGATTQELKELRATAIQAGIATQYSPVEATLGLRSLAQAGYSAREQMQLLQPVLDLAAGSLGELSPQAAAGLAAQTLKAFGLQADQATLSMDRMLKSVNMFALTPGELPLTLGIASRGAVVLHQSLSETLISAGLVKNIIPTVERASTAVAVTMERLADPAVQQALKAHGVAVADATGRFRPFLDIMLDISEATKDMTEAQKAAYIGSMFGTRSLAGLSTITTQLNSGIRTTTGELLKGADAVEYYREKMRSAGGTASDFSSKMLATYEGQKLLLKGTLQTIGVVSGTPFATMFGPAIKIITTELNKMLASMSAGEGIFGKFADLANRTGLALRSLSQLFEQGGFSGDVLKELGKVENQGLKKFVVQVWHWAGVVGQFFDGMAEGWHGAWATLSPGLSALWQAFKDIFVVLGIVDRSAAENASTWDTLGNVGANVGAGLAWLSSILVDSVAFALRAATTAVMLFRENWAFAWPVVRPIIYAIADAVMFVGAILNGDWTTAWRRGAALVIDVVGHMMEAVSALLVFSAKAVDWLGKVFGADLGIEASLTRQLDAARSELFKFREEVVTGVHTGPIVPWTSTALPMSNEESVGVSSLAGLSVAPAEAMSTRYEASMAAAAGQTSSALMSVGTPAGGAQELRATIPVLLDGEKIGEAVGKFKLRQERRAFAPMSPIGQGG